MDDHEGHKQLDRPQVHAVEEVADRVGMPPVAPPEGDGHPRGDSQAEGCQSCHPEYVYPGGHVGRLAVGQQFPGGEEAQAQAPDGPGPGRVAVLAAVWLRTRVPGTVLGLAVGGLAVGGLAGPLSPWGMVRETNKEGDAEDDDHHCDQDQVGHRDGEDRPVQVTPRPVQVDEAHEPASHSSPQTGPGVLWPRKMVPTAPRIIGHRPT